MSWQSHPHGDLECQKTFMDLPSPPSTEKKSLVDYRGKVLLIVNVASYCGFTSQYKQLQELYWKYSERGFHILAFPCNQFGNQEPDEKITSRSPGVSITAQLFPCFQKLMLMATTLNLYLPNLKSVVLGLFDTQAIKWNFTKFLIDSTGGPVKQYAPIISSRIIAKDIERQLVL